MRIKKLVIGLLVGASLLVGQATVGAWNGNTAASPETYKCTQINTAPGNLTGVFNPFTSTTCFTFSFIP